MIPFMISIFAGLLLIGVPISLTLALVATLPLYFFTDVDVVIIAQRMFNATNSFTMMAVPFFMLAGGIFSKGGVSKRLVNLADSLVGWMPGGLAVVTFVASAFFGAISGSSPATVAAIGAIMVPAMIDAGYSLHFALATVASAGFLGIVIPPSIPMVMYGVSASQNVGDMFISGVIPGILLTVGMSTYAYLYGRKNLPKGTPFKLSNVLAAIKDAIWAIFMPVIILGGIYGGIFTPTEAAVVSCFYGIFVGLFAYRELKISSLPDLLSSSIVQAGTILFIVATATAFGFVMTRENIPAAVANGLVSVSSGNKWVFLILVNLLLLVVGTFMETIPAILILTPILLPAAQALGIDPVHFGTIMVINLGIGMATPPVGINLFVAAGLVKKGLGSVVCRHLWMYLLFALVILMLVVFVPEFATFLPSIMK